ncbi:hypothetical protein [Stutzerimonas nitrititolerans]|uniref:hypothetical protein n=1 Tax=Stutzerimonas nitrititolerans TaxID=2482751 RepID=UPI002898162A|nr:hypothetical protein [Stutzerimonas nitrititolerans]
MSKIAAKFQVIQAKESGYCGYDFELVPEPVFARKMIRGGYGYVGYSGLDLSIGGLQAGGWGDVFFDNVFITPAVIDAGLVTGGETFEFAVWHSYRSSLGLHGVEEFGGEAVDLAGDRSGSVFSFVPSTYQVSLNQNSGDVAYRATFDFGAAGSYDFKFTASLALVVHWPIDWSMQPELRQSYLTEVIESWDGSEQRISLRDQPRLSATYQYGLSDADQYLFGSLVGNFSGQFLVPVWPMQSELIAPVSRFDAKAFVLNLSAVVTPGSRVMLSDGDAWEIAVIDAISEEGVSFKELVKKNYRIGSRLVPIHSAWISDEANSIAHGLDVELTSASFDFDVVEPPAPIDDFVIFNSRRVLDVRADRSKDCTIQYKRLRETLDPGIGRRHIYDRTSGAVKYLQYSWRFFTEYDRQRFEFFSALERGSQGEFYIESPLTAMKLAKDIGPATLDITINRANYKNFLKSRTFAPAISIHLYNGTVLYRNVKSVEEGLEETEVITLRESVENINKDDVEYIAPLFLGRFESDEFNYIFDTPVDSSITKIIKQLLYVDSEIDREVAISQ